MPFWRKENKNKRQDSGDSGSSNGDKTNLRQKLERKVYLAEESPEPVYDLSDCGAKIVPSGTYSKCKVWLKQGLLLNDNELTSLKDGGSIEDMKSSLQVLDLHKNHFEKLPDEIGALTNLRVLHLHRNNLKKLPDSLGGLELLQTLNVSHNLLKALPESLSKLNRLKTLDVSHNPKLKKLPSSLANCRSMEKLALEEGNQLQYPPSEICQQGTEAVMRFLCKECDMEYMDPLAYEPPAVGNGVTNGHNKLDDDPYERIVSGSLKMLEKQKEDKIKGMQLLENERVESQVKEAALAASAQDSRRKLLDTLAKEDAKMEKAVKDLQRMKDQEKTELLSSLQNVEGRTDALIGELMAASSSRKKAPQELLREMEAERREMEDMFTIRAGEAERLKENDVLGAMQSVMEEEMRRERLRREYELGKEGVVRTMQTMDLENDRAVENVLSAKGKQQQELISNLLESEKYQREAFAALFMKQDAKNKEISHQVEQVQAELTSLSMVEMTKKDLKVEFENDLMREKRETLTAMLLELMDQKQQRQEELTIRLREMEQAKSEEQDNYWLIQYQKLLDNKPKSLVEAENKVDPALGDLLAKAGAEDYIPVFAARNLTLKQVSYMKDGDLSELGMHNTYLRQKVLACLEEHEAKDHKGEPDDAKPSAPTMEQGLVPSAPPAAAAANGVSAPPATIETFRSTECCVCMERKCEIIFLPCGHVCCCWNCERGLSSCPLCRETIAQKVHLS